MPIAITSVTGVGGNPPTQIVVTGTVETCERIEVQTSCTRGPVLVDIPTGGVEPWTATLPNDEGCRCGAEIKVTARCTIGQQDQVDGLFVLSCGECSDDPETLWSDPFCVHGLSKNVRGRLRVAERTAHACPGDDCRTLRTSARLDATITSNAGCDSPLVRPMRGAVEASIVTAFDTDAEGRGVHAGRFQWRPAQGTLIEGELSGTVNAGILRGTPFKPACEKCRAPGVLTGRLCGAVVRTDVPAWRGASVIAVYRLLVVNPDASLGGAVKGTLEGAVMPPC